MTSRIFFSFLVLVIVCPCRAEEPDAQAIYQKTLKASAWVVHPGRSRLGASGFVVDRSRRWVVTNQHVVREAKTVAVFFPKKDAKGLVTERKAYHEGESIFGRVLATDAIHDLAVIELDRIPDEVRELKLAESRPGLGERVFLVGNPAVRNLWETNTGTVARFTSQAPKAKKEVKQRPSLGFWVRDDSPGGPGYSGGPVVNSKGLVVGISAMGPSVNPQFLEGLPRLTGLLASASTGPLPFLACAPVKPRLMGWCIEVRELEDVLALVRKDPAKAQKLLHPFFGQDYIELGQHYLERGRLDVALMDFEKAVKEDPNNARAYCCRGIAYRNLGNSSKALADFQEAMEHDSKDSSPFRERGLLYFQQKKYDRAFADANEAIGRDSKDSKAFLLRGLAYGRLGEHIKAGEDFAEAVRLGPADAGAHNALAWHLTTCPEERLRSGSKGLEHASRACELSHWKNLAMLDTLAAAHAECGQFPEAIKWQTKALELANKRQTEEFRQRLQLYQKNQPYRQAIENKSASRVQPSEPKHE